MLRTVQQHHAHLSALADHKAGIIIAANSILFSLAFTRNLQQVDWAALLLMAGVATLTLVLLAIGWRPLVLECFDPAFASATGAHGGKACYPECTAGWHGDRHQGARCAAKFDRLCRGSNCSE
jgi:hypothetical protein